MCGITGIFNHHSYQLDEIIACFNNGKARGPEFTSHETMKDVFLGFHRLAINGLDVESNQPFVMNKCFLICNGEIYNWKQLKSTLPNINYTSNSDCEIILHLYIKYGIKHTLQLLDGVFAFIILDLRDELSPKSYVARDTYGVRPLFTVTSEMCHTFGFSSEIKMMYDLNKYSQLKFTQFPPGHYLECEYSNSKWESRFVYNCFSSANAFTNPLIGEHNVLETIRNSLIHAVQKRVDNTDREIACLLSGGLDSSLITAIVANSMDNPKNLTTWSIGMEGSEDLKYAKIVANHLGTNHNEILLHENDFLKAIPEVIRAIESYDTTTVRASVGNWLVSKFIKEKSNAKVVFNGDGSDEVTGGYMYFHLAENEIEFDKECRRLLSQIHFFDVLRSDRSISSHGLEARTPFLDRNFVATYLSIPPKLRYHPNNGKVEKYLLRKAFDSTELLPKEVLWRTKEAFSDGVSKMTRSWFEIIQEEALAKGFGSDLKTAEKKWYYKIFSDYYGTKNDNVIPYFWMPKYVDADDASARTLKIYSKQISNTTELECRSSGN